MGTCPSNLSDMKNPFKIKSPFTPGCWSWGNNVNQSSDRPFFTYIVAQFGVDAGVDGSSPGVGTKTFIQVFENRYDGDQGEQYIRKMEKLRANSRVAAAAASFAELVPKLLFHVSKLHPEIKNDKAFEDVAEILRWIDHPGNNGNTDGRFDIEAMRRYDERKKTSR